MLNRASLALIALSLGLAGCGRVPSAPTDLAPTSSGTVNMVAQRPSLPPGVIPVSLAITPNRGSIPVGNQQGFQIAIKASDGKTYTDPRLVTWSISDPQAGSINDQGVFTPLIQRVVTVHAALMDKFADATITIVPAVYTWQQVQSPTVNDLYGVKMVAPREAWVAGAGGTIVHLLNGSWQVMNYPIPKTFTWRSVDFANQGTGWIVGYQGDSADGSGPAISLAFRDGYWVPTPVGVNGALLSVSVVARDNAWAVGRDSQGKQLIMHWNGAGWVRDPYAAGGQLNAIQMLGASDGWAVGKEGLHVVTLHYDGQSWKNVPLPPFFEAFASSELDGLCMLNGQQGYAVGKKTDMLGVTHGLMIYYDGRSSNVINFSNWSEKRGASGTTKYLDQVPLHGISMIDADKGWILGSITTPNRTEDPASWLGGTLNDIFGNLLGFNGVSYDIDNNFQHYNLSSDFTGIHVLPQGDGCIVGKRGYIMQRAYDWRGVQLGNPTQATSSTNPYPQLGASPTPQPGLYQ
jgi:hypothetical protein